jgi:hypothetical protein
METQQTTQQAQAEFSNSTINTIQEIERTLRFWNSRLNLGLDFENITITISELHKNTLGHFANINTSKAFENTKQKLNVICLNSIHLKKKPYTTIIHELAHYINYTNGVKDCSSNQYHNKHFKEQAEKLFLNVEKSKRGFAHTSETEEFKALLNELQPSPKAFHIAQIETDTDKQKAKSRLYKWVCDCGYIVRCGDRTLKAKCENCNSNFICED